MNEVGNREKFIEDGIRLSRQLKEYVDVLDYEFNHPDMPPRLRTLAMNGLKMTTGNNLDQLKALADNWKQISLHANEFAGTYDETAYKKNAQEWIFVLEKLLRFVSLIPAEAKRILPTQQTDEDIKKYFADNSHSLLRECISWLENISGKNQFIKISQTEKIAENNSSLGLDNPSLLALEIVCFKKSYDKKVVLEDISLKVRCGECFGLLGPNGTGKTSLVECIEGIRPFDSGLVSVLGYRLLPNKTSIPQSLRAKIGAQVQATGFYPLLTVGETVRMFASLYPKVPSFYELMECLDLWQIEKKMVKHLSGGQFQRLSLAVALLHDPELLFLDEPTTGLDPSARRMIWDVIIAFRKKGHTVFLTTHDMSEADFLCNRIAIMAAGKIIEEGAPARLIERHIGERTIELSIQGTVNNDEILALPEVKRCWTVESKVIIQSANERVTLASLCDTTFKQGTILGMTVRKGNLEDVYLKLNKGI
jgi:ABC-2 type transport system ATP-binding protein